MKKCFLFFIILSIQISALKIDNPYYLARGSYPILLSSTFDDYNYIITSGKAFKISKENGTIVDTADFLEYDVNFILFRFMIIIIIIIYIIEMNIILLIIWIFYHIKILK